jgi:hypothetical protein
MSRLLPTPLELRALPPRAVIAFAVRCCRRIQPLYDLPHDQPHPASLEGPLCAAEAFARGDTDVDDVGRLALALLHAANAAHYAAHAWSCLEPWEHHHREDPSANAAAAYATEEARDNRHRAADEALEANRAVGEPGPGGDLATLVAQVARAATHVTATHVAVKTRPAVASDFQKLRELGALDVLDPSEAGPLGALWPAGEPEWAGVRE